MKAFRLVRSCFGTKSPYSRAAFLDTLLRPVGGWEEERWVPPPGIREDRVTTPRVGVFPPTERCQVGTCFVYQARKLGRVVYELEVDHVGGVA